VFNIELFINRKKELKSYLITARQSLGENDEKLKYKILNIKSFKAKQMFTEKNRTQVDNSLMLFILSIMFN